MNTTCNGAGATSTTGNVVAPRFVTILAARASNARPSGTKLLMITASILEKRFSRI